MTPHDVFGEILVIGDRVTVTARAGLPLPGGRDCVVGRVMYTRPLIVCVQLGQYKTANSVWDILENVTPNDMVKL